METTTIDALLAEGLKPVENPPVLVNGRLVPPAPESKMPRALVGTIPAEFQLDADLANQQYSSRVPTYRLMPVMASGQASPNSSILSQIEPVKTEVVKNTVAVSIPVVSVDSSGNTTLAPLNKLPVPPKPRMPVTQDNVGDGFTYNRIKASEVVTGFVKQVNDGTNVRNASDIGTVVKVGGHIQSSAVVDGRTEGVGTTVQKLNSSGLLLDSDQVAADGATYLRSPQYSGSAVVLDNPNFVAGTAGWSPDSGVTLSQVSQSPFTNGKALQVSTSTQFAGAIHVRSFKASPGDVFFMTCWIKSDGTFQAQVTLRFYDGSGSQLSSAAATSVSTSWTQLSFTGTALANTATVRIALVRGDAAGGTQICQFTDPHVVRVASLDNEVQDGSTYGRVVNTALTSNQPDLSKSGIINRVLTNIADDATYLRTPVQMGQALAVPDPNFVVGVQSWTSNSANLTLTQDTTSPFTNGKSMKLVDATGGATPLAALKQQFKVTPGDSVFWSAYLKSDGVYDVALTIAQFDGANNQLGATDIGPTTSTSWTQFSGTLTATTNAAYIVLRVNRRDAGTGTQSAWITNVQLTRAASLDTEVIDGTTRVALAASHASNNVAYNFKGAWSNATSYVIADEVTFNNIYWIAISANSNSQPSTSNANWQAVGRIQGDLQIFTSSGTWSKPAAGTFAIITVIGGGAGGTGGTGLGSSLAPGGFPGGFSSQILPLSVLGSTETITVGGGGGGGAGGVLAAGVAGSPGGTTSFGNWLKATGGTSSAAGSGNIGSNGLSMVGGSGGNGGNASSSSSSNGSQGASGATARNASFAGGTGGASASSTTANVTASPGNPGTPASTDEPAGGGGGGGGGGATTKTSAFNATGGAGAVGGNYGSGGGGGGAAFSGTGTATGGNGGNGSAGLVIVAVY